MGSHPFNFNPPSAHRHANTRAFPRNITISVRETITLSLVPSTLHRCVASLFREHSFSSRFLSPPHQHILQPNALYASSARPTSPLSPSLSTCAFSSSFSPPAIPPSSTCNHARIIFTHSRTHAAHKTSRVTFYPSQVHTLSLTAFECCSSHARQQGDSPLFHSFSLALPAAASSRTVSSFVSRAPSLSLAPWRALGPPCRAHDQRDRRAVHLCHTLFLSLDVAHPPQ